MITRRRHPIAATGGNITHGNDDRQLLFLRFEQGETNFLAGKGRTAGGIDADHQRLDLVIIERLVNLFGDSAAGGHAGSGLAAHDFTGNGNDTNG